MTLVEDIIAAHAGVDGVTPGDLVTVTVDRVYMQDGNTPTIRRLVDGNELDVHFPPERVGVFFDHAVLSPDGIMSDRLREAERWARGRGFQVFGYGAGISHVVCYEAGWYAPRSIAVGADSHTCTGGVNQCLALGMGASDVVSVLATGQTWLRVPATTVVRTAGTPLPSAGAKDVLLHALARFGQEPFLYRAVEWTGEWVESLPPDAAATVANMGVEMGCKCVFLPPGPGRTRGLTPLPSDPSSSIELELDVDGQGPWVARPHSPLDGVPLDECAGQEIDYVFVGSCTNGRYSDLAQVAEVLGDARVRPGVHCIVTPGSSSVYVRALRDGVVERLVTAGALVTPPGCGPCVGTQGSIPAGTDRVVTTTSRNFKGRMGNAGASIWLASPLVAAHAAVLGRLPSTSDLT